MYNKGFALRKAKLQHLLNQNSRINKIYVEKKVYYGSYIERNIYKTVRLSFKTARVSYKKAENGTKRDSSTQRARKKVYQITEANVFRHGTFKPIFFTLTTASQTNDYKRQNSKIKGFIRRLNIYVGFKIKYIIVPEKHKSGMLHYHGVFFNLPFIPVAVFAKEIWGHGMVDLQVPKKRIKSIARYIAKYMTKDYNESTPLHTKLYFTSRGLFLPHDSFDDNEPEGYDIIEKGSYKNKEVIILKKCN